MNITHNFKLKITTMRAGRITLQGKHRVVGHNGKVVTGDPLIKIMKQLEGQQVVVRWLDDNEGNVLKSLVYDLKGSQICELLGDLSYHRSPLERTDQCEINRRLTSAYVATVQSYIKQVRTRSTLLPLWKTKNPKAKKHS